MESTHANAKASVSGHCLDFSGKSMKCESKKRDAFLSQKEKLTEDVFATLEVDLKIFAQEEQRNNKFLTENIFVRRKKERVIGLRIILSKRVKGRKGVRLRIFCPSKMEKRRVKGVRRGVRGPVR